MNKNLSISTERVTVKVLDEEPSNQDISFKVIIVGDSGVGKSCLTMKAIKNIFSEGHNATVGFDFFTFCTTINEDTSCKLQIWDTCGQEAYKSLITSFYRNTSLAMMVYSIDDLNSFNNIKSWHRDLKLQSSPNVKTFLIGNKCDLEERREVKTELAEELKKEEGFDFFIETSAKTGFNAENVFIEAVKELYVDYMSYNEASSMITSPMNVSALPIPRPSYHPPVEEKKKGCCE